MNARFHQLASHLGCSNSALVDALYMLRVPRTLTAIIPMAREFRDWRRQYPELASLPDQTDDASRLRLLDAIASLAIDDEALTGAGLARYRNPWTPLRPLTGDSVIGELLLTQPAKGVDSPAYTRLAAWLLWQAQRFHVAHTTHQQYADYLLASSQELRKQRHGSRLYNSFLALRHLTDSSNETQLRDLAACGLELNADRSLALTLFARLNRLSGGKERSRLHRYAVDKLGVDETALDTEAARIGALLPQPMALLLTTVWGKHLDLRAGVTRRSGGGSGGRQIGRPRIIRGARLTELHNRADEDEVHAGTVVDFLERSDDATYEDADRDPADDDPEEEDQAEPAFSLFLADRDDLINGYYAAKGMQNAIEYKNAQLPWDRSTLSRSALQTVLALIADTTAGGDRLTHCARLAIGLSLLTGRALMEVARPFIVEGGGRADADNPIVISLQYHRLSIRAGQPKLRNKPASSPFCKPIDQILTLPLPADWQPLVAAIGPGQAKRGQAIATRARAYLNGLPATLKVTEKGVRHALVRALGEQSRGDLGLQKLITDGSEANAQNVIHYASYEVARAEHWWRAAAETLVGSLPAGRSAAAPKPYAGAVHAFDTASLRAYFAEIQQRLHTAEANGEWYRVFNLLVLYLSYWLGLGTAGRKTREPVPSVLLAGDWALVADKRRPDGSTDRLVPLTESLREQIRAYVAFADAVSLQSPALNPVVTADGGMAIRLQYIHVSKGAVPFQPKYQEEDEQLTPLPSNWGRKLVRSETTGLAGRFRDAGMGHWARGRHAWHVTSTLDTGGFRRAWLTVQATLEHELGFTVIRPAGVDTDAQRLPGQRPVASAGKSASKPAPSPAKTIDVEPILREADEDKLDRLVDPNRDCPREIALELVRKAVGRYQGTTEDQREIAEAACAFVRQKRRIPLFAMRPRPLFANRFLLNAAGLQTLAYLQKSVLPAFHRDLAQLPSRFAPTNESEQLRRNRVELGRLVMIGIWRLGLTRWALLEAWLQALRAGSPILAVGELRVMIFPVTSETSREPMRRTVLLDAFSAAYLTIERETIRNQLLPPLSPENRESGPKNRRTRVQTAMNTYLRAIGAGRFEVTVAAMTEAAVQWLMCETAPVIAAYARGAVFSEDIDDRELRRLAGLAPRATPQAGEEQALPVFKELDLGATDLPADVAPPVLRALVHHKGRLKSEWQRLIRKYQPASATEHLLCNFALWLLERSRGKGGARFGAHEKRYYVSRVKIVAYAVLGHTIGTSGVIDDSTLAALAEVGREHFPEKVQHGAWFQFHAFLADEQADHAGFTIGRLGQPPERSVSAKILGQHELTALASTIPSAKSGIGNSALRIAAARHVELMATYGMRRSESVGLRGVDWQQDLMRVQAYDDHGLKTAWAERVLPAAFAEPQTRGWLNDAGQANQGRLIDPDASGPVNPDNFHDAINRLIKQVTQDNSLGSHHLRHTLGSRLALTLLHDTACLGGVADELPWVQDLIIDEKRISGLLGNEGDAGQGLRAVAALLGHSHPTTTIRHYVHTLCIALYGALKARDTLDITRSFENRIASRASVQRWVATARDNAVHTADGDARRHEINRLLRDRIERKCADAGIERDETPLPANPAAVDTETSSSATGDAINFDELEAIDRSLRDGQLLRQAAVVGVSKRGLEGLASVPTGKAGSSVPRHPLEQTQPGVWLPPRLAAGTATHAAATLCEWLAALKANRPDDYAWLIDKWVLASERERGRMQLDGAGEVERARGLADPERVNIQVDQAPVAKQRQTTKVSAAWRMRIKCLDTWRQPITRDTLAIRWVMSHVAAQWIGAVATSE